jgi:hypothetical protein
LIWQNLPIDYRSDQFGEIRHIDHISDRFGEIRQIDHRSDRFGEICQIDHRSDRLVFASQASGLGANAGHVAQSLALVVPTARVEV